MISETELAHYCGDRIGGDARDAFESVLAEDDAALHEVLWQERIDIALEVLLSPGAERARVFRSVLEVVGGQSRETLYGRVMDDVDAGHAPRSRSWRRSGAVVLALAAAVAFMIGGWHLFYNDRKSPGLETSIGPAGQGGDGSVVSSEFRRPADWPFAADSPWNTAIGQGAMYAELSPGGLDLSAGIHVFDARSSHQIYEAKGTDPLREVLAPGDPAGSHSLRIPSSIPYGFGPDTIHILAPDGATLHEIIQPRPRADGMLGASAVTKIDLRGSGIAGEMNAGTGTGLSRFAGSLRAEELETGIHRVIGAVVSTEAVCRRPDGKAHVWPAGGSPNDAWHRDHFRQSGNVHIGSLLAIPPEIELATLGISGPAMEIARALQDYGIYVKESVDWQPSGRPGIIVCVDRDFVPAERIELDRQLRSVAIHLKVVVNNGPNSVGGGGLRRRPPPPPFVEAAR